MLLFYTLTEISLKVGKPYTRCIPISHNSPTEVARAMDIAFKYRNFFRKVFDIPKDARSFSDGHRPGYHCRFNHI